MNCGTRGGGGTWKSAPLLSYHRFRHHIAFNTSSTPLHRFQEHADSNTINIPGTAWCRFLQHIDPKTITTLTFQRYVDSSTIPTPAQIYNRWHQYHRDCITITTTMIYTYIDYRWHCHHYAGSNIISLALPSLLIRYTWYIITYRSI